MTTQPIAAEALERDLPASREVGKNLRVIAWEKRITQTELGLAIGVGAAAVSKKMRGDAPITVDELMGMARLLDVEPGQLLPRLDSNQQPSGYRSALVGRPVTVRGWDGLEDYTAQIVEVDEHWDHDLYVRVRALADGSRSWMRLGLERLVPIELDDEAAA